MAPLLLSLATNAFSRRGSFLAISRHDRTQFRDLPPGLWLRNLHTDGGRGVFLLEVIEGEAEVEYRVGELILRAADGCARICLVGTEQARIRLEGVGLRLTMIEGLFHSAVETVDGVWVLNASDVQREYSLQPLGCALTVDAPWGIGKCRKVVAELRPGADGTGEGLLTQSAGRVILDVPRTTYQEEADAVDRDFEEFADGYPPVAPDWEVAARLAAHVNWAALLAPGGALTRPAMLMSKNWMCAVWAWDHCFNALALAERQPESAYDQFMLLFDHQTPLGQIPDLVKTDSALYNFVKPPIHGWAYQLMSAANAWFREAGRLNEVYQKLSAWTEWWFRFRCPKNDGLPSYWHGNDSGWDNGTVFDVGLPVQSPDLATFLILQMETLAEIAEVLGNPAGAAEWRTRGQVTLNALVTELWVDDRFVARQALRGNFQETEQSIIPAIPALLGERLPAEIREKLVRRIRENMTPWGLATENPTSPLYQPDGYWRGPIWAPSTLLAIEGLCRCGESELAAEIARRFCHLCTTSGFAENFNALTGEPLRDRAYTWTSSVFLYLAARQFPPP